MIDEPEIDTTRPHIARVYDYGLGGKDNYAVDREAYENLIEKNPGLGSLFRANREFLRRAVHYLAGEAGVRQFIDVGSGLPTAENVHEIAQKADPDARVVYVDKDPIVLAHGRALLARDHATTVVIQADGADPASILDHPDTTRLIDFDRPWALIMCAFLHHLRDDQDPVGVVGAFKRRMVGGCYFASSNALSEDHELAGKLEADFLAETGTGHFRGWDTHRAYFAGLEMVEPGLVYVDQWRPDRDTARATARESSWASAVTAGVGRRP